MPAVRRRLLNLLTALSLLLCVSVVALWTRTEVLGHTDTVEWEPAGVFRCLEFSADDVEFYVLSHPGSPPTPLRRRHFRNGWAKPPPPTNPAAVPPWGVTFMMPSPAVMVARQYTASGMSGAGRSVPPQATHGGVRSAGFEY